MTDIVERLREPGQCISDVGCNDGLMREATDEIDRLRHVLRRYTCECLEPCFFYDAEEAKADQMPNPPCGWWAREVLG